MCIYANTQVEQLQDDLADAASGERKIDKNHKNMDERMRLLWIFDRFRSR
jgi:hypothetical protein